MGSDINEFQRVAKEGGDRKNKRLMEAQAAALAQQGANQMDVANLQANTAENTNQRYMDMANMQFGPGGSHDRQMSMQYAPGGASDRSAQMSYDRAYDMAGLRNESANYATDKRAEMAAERLAAMYGYGEGSDGSGFGTGTRKGGKGSNPWISIVNEFIKTGSIKTIKEAQEAYATLNAKKDMGGISGFDPDNPDAVHPGAPQTRGAQPGQQAAQANGQTSIQQGIMPAEELQRHYDNLIGINTSNKAKTLSGNSYEPINTGVPFPLVGVKTANGTRYDPSEGPQSSVSRTNLVQNTNLPMRRPNGAELGGRDYDPNINQNWSSAQLAAYDASKAGQAARQVTNTNNSNWDAMVASGGKIPSGLAAPPSSVLLRPPAPDQSIRKEPFSENQIPYQANSNPAVGQVYPQARGVWPWIARNSMAAIDTISDGMSSANENFRNSIGSPSAPSMQTPSLMEKYGQYTQQNTPTNPASNLNDYNERPSVFPSRSSSSNIGSNEMAMINKRRKQAGLM